MASLTQCTWVWVDSKSLWWTGIPGMLQSKGSQKVERDWVTELNWTELNCNPWTVAHQGPLFLLFMKSWDFLGKNTGVSMHSLLQGILLPNQGSNPDLCIAGRFFDIWATRETHCWCWVSQFSRVWLFATPWTAASQASLSVTISQGLIKQVSGHLIFSTYLNCSVKWMFRIFNLWLIN